MLIQSFESIPENSILVFLHITKTGGVSFDRVLKDAFGNKYFRESQTKGTYLKDLKGKQKKNIKAISGHFKYGAHSGFPSMPLYITCLRDPVDRIESLFNHISRKKNHPLNDKALELGLDKFCIDLAEGKLSAHYSQCEIISGKNDFLQAREFLRTFLIYCELSQLNFMQKAVYEKLTGNTLAETKRENVSSSKKGSDKTRCFSSSTREFLENKYLEDIKLCRYAHEKFDSYYNF